MHVEEWKEVAKVRREGVAMIEILNIQKERLKLIEAGAYGGKRCGV